MKMTAIARASGMVLAGALIAVAPGVLAAPAHADQMDDAFINLLDQRGVPYSSKSDAILLAKETCNILGRQGGNQVQKAVNNAKAETKLPLKQLSYFIGGSVAAYCPDKKLY